MRVLHVGYQRFDASGIANQMSFEQMAADQLGLQWTSQLFLPSDAVSVGSVIVKGKKPSTERWASRQEFYSWIKNAADSFDVLLLRNTVGDTKQASFIADLGKPVFTVHHTLEGPEILSRPSFRGYLKWLLDQRTARASLKKARGIVAVTAEIGAYETSRTKVAKPIILYPNGIAINDEPVAGSLSPSEHPEFLFVASHFTSWQGLDRLVKSARSSNSSFVLHLVGDVGEQDRAAIGDDPRFQLHGKLGKGEIAHLSKRAALGLGSFALDRKRMREACTLKVREYLSLGLPVYSGHFDIFPNDFPYYRAGPCQIERIMEMALEARSWEREHVRAASAKYIDKRSLLLSLHSDLGRLCAL